MAAKLFPQCDPSIRNRLAKKHWPDGIAFTDADGDLVARGWPHLRLVVDGDPRDKKPAALAKKVRAAIDPVIPIAWPREAARHFICAFAGQPAGEITLATLDAVLEQAIGRVVGYAFHVADAVFLCEAFLGPDAVAERIVERLAKLSAAEKASDNPNDKTIIVISLLEPLLLRCSKKVAVALTTRIRGLALGSKLPGLRHAMLVRSELPAGKAAKQLLYNVPVLTVNHTDLSRYLAHEYGDWLLDPQHLYIAGPAIVDDERHLAPMRRMPGWRQKWVCEVFGIIDHAVIGRLMTVLAGSRGAGGMPEDWLAAHPEHAQGEPPAKKPPKRPLTNKQLDVAVGKLFDKLVSDLERVRGKVAEEKKIWTAAVRELIELRIANGNPTPEFHIGHIFAVDGWDPHPPPFETLEPTAKESDRWFDYIDAAR